MSDRLTIDVLSPVYRSGEVLDARTASSGSRRLLSAVEALDVANRVKERAHVLRDMIVDKMREGKDSDIDYSMEAASLKRLANPIVDFPEFTVLVAGVVWFCRLCLTVCVDDKMSKIWMRCTPRISPDGRVETYEQMSRIWKQCHEFRQVFLPVLRAFYDEELRNHFGGNVLAIKHKINIAALDFLDPSASYLVSLCRRGEPISEILAAQPRCDKIWEIFATIFFDREPYHSNDYRTVRDCLFDEVSRLTPRVSSRNEDQSGVFIPSLRGDELNYFGFTDGSETDGSDTDRGEGAAFYLTGLLINLLVKPL